MSMLDYIYIIIGFDITYVIIAIAHANVGHDPFVKVDYENFNIILFNFSFLMENEPITI